MWVITRIPAGDYPQVEPERPAGHGVQAVVLSQDRPGVRVRHYGLKRRSVGRARLGGHGVQAVVLSQDRPGVRVQTYPYKDACFGHQLSIK